MNRRICSACQRDNGAARKCCVGCGSRLARVGTTILGDPSVADVKSLIEAKDFTLKRLANGWQAIAADWAARDPAAQQDFAIDLGALVDRYNVAKAFALGRMQGLASYSDATESWNAILKSLRQNWDEATQTGGALAKGDLSELDLRLERAGGKPDYSGMPQPNVADDHSLALFKAADKATRVIERTARDIVQGTASALPWIALAAVALVVVAKR